MFALVTKSAKDSGRPPSLKRQVELLQDFYSRTYPESTLKGPYSASFKLLLFSFAGIILKVRNDVLKQQLPSHTIPTLTKRQKDQVKLIKLTGFIYGSAIIAAVFRSGRALSSVTYTFQSWSLTTVRCLLGYLALRYDSNFLRKLEELLRFPMLVQNVVTFFVWYLVLMPGILIKLQKAKGKRKSIISSREFLNFAFSPILLNLHGVNLPFALLNHFCEPRAVDLRDFYNGLVSAFAYFSFYLGVLDANGLPVYFILCPRKLMGSISFAGILTSYVVIFKAIQAYHPFP